MIRHLPRSLKQVPPSLIPTAVEEIEGRERDIMLLGALTTEGVHLGVCITLKPAREHAS